MLAKWAKMTIALMALVSTVAALKNTYDEMYQLSTMSEFWTTVGMWLLIPYGNAYVGFRSKRVIWIGGTLVFSIFLAALFVFYALNGSTIDRPEGAQHVHLLMVPMLTTVLFVMMLCALGLLDFIHKLFEKNKPNTEVN